MTFLISYDPPGCSGPPDESDYDACQDCGGELDNNGSRCSSCEQDYDDYLREIAAEQRADRMGGL